MSEILESEIEPRLFLARTLLESGLSIIPIKADGSKASAIFWKPYQSRKATDEEIQEWFGNGNSYGVAVVAGQVSGNLEVLDFEEEAAFGKWHSLLTAQGGGDLFKKLVVVLTPSGGSHVYYRCPDGVEKNQKLARAAGEDGAPIVLIETRGEGGYALLPGSPESCHDLNKPYRLWQGSLSSIPNITAPERALLLELARALNEYVDPNKTVSGAHNEHGNRPGDDFNRRATWEEVLEPDGWKKVGTEEEVITSPRSGELGGCEPPQGRPISTR